MKLERPMKDLLESPPSLKQSQTEYNSVGNRRYNVRAGDFHVPVYTSYLHSARETDSGEGWRLS